MTKIDFMKLALEEAKKAGERDEIPIGALLVDSNNKIIASSGNKVFQKNDPTAHAEMEVIRIACSIIGSNRLNKCDLYVTLEPCSMCAHAISLAKIRRLYFGAFDTKGGGVENGPSIFNQPNCNYAPQVIGGLYEIESAVLLKNFFSKLRL